MTLVWTWNASVNQLYRLMLHRDRLITLSDRLIIRSNRLKLFRDRLITTSNRLMLRSVRLITRSNRLITNTMDAHRKRPLMEIHSP